VSLAETVTKLLRGLTPERLARLAPDARRRLSGELQRVYRIVEADPREARKPTASRSGVLGDLKLGNRAE